jgi:hypothetical protein
MITVGAVGFFFPRRPRISRRSPGHRKTSTTPWRRDHGPSSFLPELRGDLPDRAAGGLVGWQIATAGGHVPRPAPLLIHD